MGRGGTAHVPPAVCEAPARSVGSIVGGSGGEALAPTPSYNPRVAFTAGATGRTGLKGNQIRRGLDFFSFIPAIDQLVRAPRFIGSDLFYGNFYEPQDAVPDAFPRALSRRARGRVPIEKLRDKIGDEPLEAYVRALLSDEAPDPRQRAAQLTGEDLGPFFALWLEGGGLRTPENALKAR